MKTLPFALLALLLCSCAVQTPQARIERNSALYDSLSSHHQTLVQQGQITEGMPSAGVFLAWGKPQRRSDGFQDGKAFQRWDYTALQPIYTNHFTYGYGSGYGYGRYRRHGHHHYGIGHGVDYIPYRARTVIFRSDRVDAWEVNSPRY